MSYPHILAEFSRTPLAILPEKLEAIREFLYAKQAGQDIDPDKIKAISAARRPGGVSMSGRVAILPVFGVISQRVSGLEEASGGVSTEAIGGALDSLVADKQVRAIVLAFDSPGGSVFGVQELADKIRGYRGEKKIVGLADSLAASAAYWLISQCAEVNVTPGGQVGSIGVITAHQDVSAWEERKGFKTTLVTAGDHKAEASPFGPLTDEARQELQSKVDAYYGMFVGAVAKGRGVSEARVRADYGKGRMFTAQAAVDAGLADKVATIETVLRRLGGESGGTSAPAAHARARAVEVG